MTRYLLVNDVYCCGYSLTFDFATWTNVTPSLLSDLALSSKSPLGAKGGGELGGGTGGGAYGGGGPWLACQETRDPAAGYSNVTRDWAAPLLLPGGGADGSGPHPGGRYVTDGLDSAWEDNLTSWGAWLYRHHALANVSVTWQTQEELLESYLGKRHISLAAVVLLTALYTLIFLSGVLGNVCTCIVIARNRSMHTATNYYLFSLAVSDVLTLLLALPQEMSSIWEAYPWRFGTAFCFIKSFVSEMTSYASVLTITAFTVDRYVAICHPLRSQSISSLARAVKIILLAWGLACCCALPYPVKTRVYYEVSEPCTKQGLPDSLLCNIPPEERLNSTYLFQFSTFVFFFVPMLLITIMYALIGLALKTAQRHTDHKKNKSAVIAATKARKAILKMLVAVVIAFFVCWAPFHTQRLMTIYVPPNAWTQDMLKVQTYVFYISGVLYFFNSTINPILYNVLSRRYRKFFKRTLYRCLRLPQSDYNDTSVYRSTPLSTNSQSAYANNRLLVRNRAQDNGSCCDVESSTV